MLQCEVNGTTQMIELENTLYIPSFQLTLMSVRRLNKAGYYTVFKGGTCKVKTSKDRKTMLTGLHKGDLYHLNVILPVHALALININILHQCLAHISPNRLIQMVNNGCVEGIDKITGKAKFCEPCVLAKSKKLPFKHEGQQVTHPFQVIHSDVGGPVNIADCHGNRYWISFINDYGRFPWVYFM